MNPKHKEAIKNQELKEVRVPYSKREVDDILRKGDFESKILLYFENLRYISPTGNTLIQSRDVTKILNSLDDNNKGECYINVLRLNLSMTINKPYLEKELVVLDHLLQKITLELENIDLIHSIGDIHAATDKLIVLSEYITKANNQIEGVKHYIAAIRAFMNKYYQSKVYQQWIDEVENKLELNLKTNLINKSIENMSININERLVDYAKVVTIVEEEDVNKIKLAGSI